MRVWYKRTHLCLCFFIPPAFLCSSVYSSYDETLQWESACSESYYDFYATLYFCHSNDNVFGYRTVANANHCDSADDLSPIIRMQAGMKYQLKLINLSTSQPTNIHTHGLHIPGVGNTDNIRRLAEPNGGILYYNWTIPADHLDGTFWYHSHAHGYSLEQKSGGAAGMMFIDRNDGYDRPDWMRRERLLHIVDSSDETLPFIFTKVRANGQKQERITLERNVWHLLRLNFVAFPITTRRFDFTSNCEVRTAAYDGVWRETVPSSKIQRTYKLFHANRLDVAIKCSSPGALYYTLVPGLDRSPRYLASLLGLSNFIFPALVNFQVTDGVNQASSSSDLQYWTPQRPAYLQDLRGETVAKNTYSVQVTTHLVNNVEFGGNSDPPLATFEYGSLQQWKLINTPQLIHPIHLHLYHMQVVTKGGCGSIFEEGQWFDTIAPPSTGCTVRFRMMDIAGRAVLHCHIPLHAEQGAIGYVLVDHGPNISENDIDENAEEFCAALP
jgi:FtsP/CotA-like multicopper oxidase with cupredoxin domain